MTRDRRLRLARYRLQTAIDDRADALDHLGITVAVAWVLAGILGSLLWCAHGSAPDSTAHRVFEVGWLFGVPSVSIAIAMLPAAVADVVRAWRAVTSARANLARLQCGTRTTQEAQSGQGPQTPQTPEGDP